MRTACSVAIKVERGCEQSEACSALLRARQDRHERPGSAGAATGTAFTEFARMTSRSPPNPAFILASDRSSAAREMDAGDKLIVNRARRLSSMFPSSISASGLSSFLFVVARSH